jgi:hypothetical protein
MADRDSVVYLHYNVFDQEPDHFLTFGDAKVLC